MNSASLAPVWPQLGTIPRLRHAAANAAPPGCSGAYETILTGDILSIASTSFISGLRTNFGFWAPQHLELMNGPSRWMPATFENFVVLRYSATAFAAATRLSLPTVRVVGRNVVQPSASFASAIFSIASTVASHTSYPQAPWRCTSINPGTTYAPFASKTQSFLPGFAAFATFVIFPSTISTAAQGISTPGLITWAFTMTVFIMFISLIRKT